MGNEKAISTSVRLDWIPKKASHSDSIQSNLIKPLIKEKPLKSVESKPEKKRLQSNIAIYIYKI